MKSSLTGIKRSKANALYKAKSTQPQGNPNKRKRGRRSGGGPAATATSGGGGAVVQQQQQQGGYGPLRNRVKYPKFNCFGHKAEE
jgi:hypothetical protein